jgi:peptide/nickel transport system permease protein
VLRFIVRRLLQLVPILLGLSILLFVWIRSLPGGPAVALLGERATPEKIALINRLYGLDRPLWGQYLSFLGRAVRLDFGTSLRTQRPVTEEFLRLFPATMELSVVALTFAVGVGIPLGYVAARRHMSWVDNLSVTGSLIGVTIPVFFLGFILRYVFAVRLGWLPATGRQDTRTFIGLEHPTNFFVLDGFLVGRPDASWDALLHLILPGIALGTIPLAIITRITRASVLDVVHEDYVRTAEAKGLTTGTITRRHILRNALLPVATITGLQVGLLLSGAVLTETVFAFPGIGSFLVESIKQRDYAVIQGFILVIAVIIVVVNLLVDISYGLIDPRVRVR